ncbi:hypothetical protein [Cellulosilyticum ruminicola]|uniref:hypothetical protein n=1 Tax=Cellulosilyticum ruminicola TaxID=425254 RepID=UPI0012ECD0E0|nr:hypothetical protein [Cellulosilyticum ruminicola]
MFTNRLGIIMRNVEQIMEGQSKGKQRKVQVGPYRVEQEVADKLEEIKFRGGRLS